MDISRALLAHAERAGVLQHGQADAFWQFAQAELADRPTFKPAHILHYLGGLTAIGAMTLFMTLGWERLGGGGLFAIALGYAVIVTGATEYLLRVRRLAIPAGILSALAVALVPLAIYGLQRWLGWWPEDGVRHHYRDYHAVVDWRWLMMELATLAAGAVALWRWRLPFGVLPVAVTLWYLGMDIVPVLLGGDPHAFWSPEGRRISIAFGLATLALALWVDLRSSRRADFAFWLHVFGMLTFWGGLTSLDSSSELGRLAYAAVNLLLIGIGAALSRRVYAVFGGIGVALYLGHLSGTVFKDSLLFPVALAAIGLGTMAAGVFWQRHEVELGRRLRLWLPPAWRRLVEQRASAA